MAGLTDRAGGLPEDKGKALERARHSWEESMVRQIESLRGELVKEAPEMLTDRCAGHFTGKVILLPYWGQEVSVRWPELEATSADGRPCSTFDTAMLLYYLHKADGTLPADRWISYREIPGGAFYHQAFQGYSGNRLSKAFADDLSLFEAAARRLGGFKLTALAEHAFAFQPLPRIRLAAVLWPGDEDFPTRASVLFDAASHHYMTIDGLALLGGGLASRLVQASIDMQSPP